MPKLPSSVSIAHVKKKKKKSEVFCCLMIFHDHWHLFLSAGLKQCEIGAYGSEGRACKQRLTSSTTCTPQLSFSSCCTHHSTWKLPVYGAIGKNGCGPLNKTCLWLHQQVSLDTNSVECFHHMQLISEHVNPHIEVTQGPPSLYHTSPQQIPKAFAQQSSPSTCRTAGQHSSAANQLSYKSYSIKTSTWAMIYHYHRKKRMDSLRHICSQSCNLSQTAG